MADITRINPFRSISRIDPFGHEVEDLFKGFFLTPMPFGQVSSGQVSSGQFPLDVSEDDKSYSVRAEIPGFDKGDIHVAVDGDQVSISAETKKEREEKKGDRSVLRECYYGKQYRSFKLPHAVDDTKATAKYEDGVLNLVLPKKGNGAGKKIAIE